MLKNKRKEKKGNETTTHGGSIISYTCLKKRIQVTLLDTDYVNRYCHKKAEGRLGSLSFMSLRSVQLKLQKVKRFK